MIDLINGIEYGILVMTLLYCGYALKQLFTSK